MALQADYSCFACEQRKALQSRGCPKGGSGSLCFCLMGWQTESASWQSKSAGP